MPDHNLPDDCPSCLKRACGHLCWCGYVDYPSTAESPDGQQRTSEGQHRRCCSCGTCYEVPKLVLPVLAHDEQP